VTQEQQQGAVLAASIGDEARGIARDLGKARPAGVDLERSRRNDLGRAGW